MQLLRLEVKNWCQHKHRVCNFTRGLVGILGKIGSGKSNIIGAICWLLTGENPNAGLKADNISQLAAENESAFATLEFEHAEHIVVVTRYLLPEKEQATLILDGVEVARGDKAVTAYIEKLLNIDSKFISRFVIVAQNELFAFIEDGTAEIDRFFQRLFGTAIADKCHDIASKHLNKLIIPEVIETSAQLAAALEQIDTEILNDSGQISALPSLDSFLAIQQEQQKIINDWAQRVKFVIDLDVIEKQFVVQTKELETANAEISRHTSDLEALRAAMGGDADSYTAAKVALGHWANYRQIAEARASAESRLAYIQQQLQDLNQAAPVLYTAATVDAMWSKLKTTEAQIKLIQSFLDTFADSGIAACPTCYTPTTNLTDSVLKFKDKLREAQEQMETYTKELTDITANNSAYGVWEKKVSELKTAAAQANTTLTELINMSAPTMGEEESAKLVVDYENFQRAEAGIKPLLTAAQNKKSEVTGALAITQERREQLSEAIANIKITEAVANLAQLTLGKLREQCLFRQTLEKKHSELVFERNKLYMQYTTAQADERKAAKLREWSQIADKAKEALKAAPRLVATRNLRKLEVAINELLQVFNVDFTVQAADDGSLSFTAEFLDGRRQPARRLSYGQKTVLALAFRVAVNALFAEEIGLLALDEPTAYLDQQRIKALSPVLEKLRDLSTARGLQCLLITHETSLTHLFESTVELDVQ